MLSNASAQAAPAADLSMQFIGKREAFIFSDGENKSSLFVGLVKFGALSNEIPTTPPHGLLPDQAKRSAPILASPIAIC